MRLLLVLCGVLLGVAGGPAVAETRDVTPQITDAMRLDIVLEAAWHAVDLQVAPLGEAGRLHPVTMIGSNGDPLPIVAGHPLPDCIAFEFPDPGTVRAALWKRGQRVAESGVRQAVQAVSDSPEGPLPTPPKTEDGYPIMVARPSEYDAMAELPGQAWLLHGIAWACAHLPLPAGFGPGCLAGQLDLIVPEETRTALAIAFRDTEFIRAKGGRMGFKVLHQEQTYFIVAEQTEIPSPDGRRGKGVAGRSVDAVGLGGDKNRVAYLELDRPGVWKSVGKGWQRF
ncbi:MAG TPA: hypothetical protein VEI97_04710 [bacterium]|nr:hypothetical protein [bacterium]